MGYVPPNPPYLTNVPLAPASYLKLHWRGELPLWVSFWVNIVLATLLFGALAAAFYALSSVAGGLFAILAVPAWVWSHVGLWRCAELRTNYWAFVAKLYCGSYGFMALYVVLSLVLTFLGYLLGSPFKQTHV